MLFQPAIHWDRGTNAIQTPKKWDTEPTDEEFEAFFPEYVEWMHSVNLALSEIIGSDHTYVFQNSYAEEPFWEFWVYHANGEKECVAKDYGRFDPSLVGRPKDIF